VQNEHALIAAFVKRNGPLTKQIAGTRAKQALLWIWQ